MRLPLFFLLIISAPAWSATQARPALSFEANQGQTDSCVRFLSRGPGNTLFLTSTEAVLRTTHDVFRMRLRGTNPASKAEGEGVQSAKSNYFIGNDQAQ